jgi:hypothetical protein
LHLVGDLFELYDDARTFPQEPSGQSVPMTNAVHFATLVHAVRPLDLVTAQQFLQACTASAMWWWWWNAKLRLQYLIIIHAILELVM